MRWPFGPPHLTLKPSKKTETLNKKQQTKKKTETETTTSNHKNKTKLNKQTKKTTPKRKKTQTRNTKTPKPSKPNKQEEAAQAFLTLLQLYQTKKHNDIKAWQETNKKTPFCHVKNNPLFFINFLFLFTYSVCIATAVFL